MKHLLSSAVAIMIAGCAAPESTAKADCSPGKAGDDLTADEALATYECLKSDLQAAYAKGGKAWIPADFVAEYPSWTRAASAPAAPGFHTGRFLMTYVNDTGKEMYLQYADNPVVPVGTRLAKESFEVSDQGQVKKGPLFLMEKGAAGSSPKTDDWFYYMVGTNGRPQGINVFAACSECHQGNFAETGGMGYPVEDVRLK